jgi:hypothetical protein
MRGEVGSCYVKLSALALSAFFLWAPFIQQADCAKKCHIKSLVRALPCANQIKLRGIILPIVFISIKMEDYHYRNKTPQSQKTIPILSFTGHSHRLTEEVKQRHTP